jgi:four helix bundle protein
MKNNGYKDLLIWQIEIDLVEQLYQMSDEFPSHERFGLTSQMRRAAVSIPSNIAEGYRRKTDADFLQFLHISFGSVSELETQVIIAFRLKYISQDQYDRLNQMIVRLIQLLTGFIHSRQKRLK